VRAVIWDYDGTLVETRFADEAAVAELVARDPASRAGAELFWATDGQPLLQRIELAWPGRTGEILPLFSQRVRPRRLRGVSPVLTELHRRGYRMAVVSSRRHAALEWGLRACGLRRFFRAVVGLGDVTHPKPDPEGLLLALELLAVAASNAVYIGDNEVDVDAGRRAGVITWRALWAHPDAAGAVSGPFALRHPREVLERLSAPPVAAVGS
jgi:pyrophosphatase PpaX